MTCIALIEEYLEWEVGRGFPVNCIVPLEVCLVMDWLACIAKQSIWDASGGAFWNRDPEEFDILPL